MKAPPIQEKTRAFLFTSQLGAAWSTQDSDENFGLLLTLTMVSLCPEMHQHFAAEKCVTALMMVWCVHLEQAKGSQ